MYRIPAVLLLMTVLINNYKYCFCKRRHEDYPDNHQPLDVYGLAETTPTFSGSFLINHVLSNVSRNFRPVKDQRSNTTVYFRLLLYQILGADSIQGKIHLHFWVEMLWQNEFVR